MNSLEDFKVGDVVQYNGPYRGEALPRYASRNGRFIDSPPTGIKGIVEGRGTSHGYTVNLRITWIDGTVSWVGPAQLGILLIRLEAE